MIEHKTILVILNPVSGNRKSKKRSREFIELLKTNFQNLSVLVTDRKGAAREWIVESLNKHAYDYVIGVGGDGTNNEIINGLMELPSSVRSKTCYCLFPTGTGNDWAKGMGITTNPQKWLDMLRGEKSAQHDLGLVYYKSSGNDEQRYFINVAGMAYDAYLVKKLEQGFMPKKNKLVYLSMLLKCLVAYKLHHAKVIWGNQSFDSRCYTLNIGINRFAGGGMEIVPSADPFDGKLSFTAAKDLKKHEVVYELQRFYNGTYEEHPKVESFDSEEIEVQCLDTDRVMDLEVDGEYIGEAPCRFVSVPAAIKVLIP